MYTPDDTPSRPRSNCNSSSSSSIRMTSFIRFLVFLLLFSQQWITRRQVIIIITDASNDEFRIQFLVRTK
jgi:hypothetical protein